MVISIAREDIQIWKEAGVFFALKSFFPFLGVETTLNMVTLPIHPFAVLWCKWALEEMSFTEAELSQSRAQVGPLLLHFF